MKKWQWLLFGSLIVIIVGFIISTRRIKYTYSLKDQGYELTNINSYDWHNVIIKPFFSVREDCSSGEWAHHRGSEVYAFTRKLPRLRAGSSFSDSFFLPRIGSLNLGVTLIGLEVKTDEGSFEVRGGFRVRR